MTMTPKNPKGAGRKPTPFPNKKKVTLKFYKETWELVRKTSELTGLSMSQLVTEPTVLRCLEILGGENQLQDFYVTIFDNGNEAVVSNDNYSFLVSVAKLELTKEEIIEASEPFQTLHKDLKPCELREICRKQVKNHRQFDDLDLLENDLLT